MGYWIIFTESMEFPDNFAFNIPLLIFSPVVEFTIEILGASVYPFPPLVTIMLSIVFEFLIVISGDMYAMGCKVLSEEYSKPSLIIRSSLILPIFFDFGTIYASFPFFVFSPSNIGSFLYPDPPETMLILWIGPFAEIEFVLYLKISHSFCEYVNFSGIFVKEILNVVDPIPEIL